MKRKYAKEVRKSRVQATSRILENEGNVVLEVPVAIAEALAMGQETAQEVCREVGLQVMQAMMTAEVQDLVGRRYERQEGREASRWGRQSGYVVLEGKRVPVPRPRVRGANGTEHRLRTYEVFQSDGARQREVSRRLLVGVSTRKYKQAVDEFVRGYGIAKSSVSRTWIRASAKALEELRERDLSGLEIPVVMVDGIGFGEYTVVVALGVERTGRKHILGLWSGATENATVGTALVEDMIRRGLNTTYPILWVLDGGKGVRAALERRFGKDLVVHRCQIHKQRNILDYLPENYQATVRMRLRAAWSMNGYEEAKTALTRVLEYLERINDGAAASLREAFEETLTLHRLGVTGPLRRSLSSTNLIESCFATTRDVTRNVKRWGKDGMAERWSAAALLEAEKRFKKVRGQGELPKLITALRGRVERMAMPA